MYNAVNLFCKKICHFQRSLDKDCTIARGNGSWSVRTRSSRKKSLIETTPRLTTIYRMVEMTHYLLLSPLLYIYMYLKISKKKSKIELMCMYNPLCFKWYRMVICTYYIIYVSLFTIYYITERWCIIDCYHSPLRVIHFFDGIRQLKYTFDGLPFKNTHRPQAKPQIHWNTKEPALVNILTSARMLFDSPFLKICQEFIHYPLWKFNMNWICFDSELLPQKDRYILANGKAYSVISANSERRLKNALVKVPPLTKQYVYD